MCFDFCNAKKSRNAESSIDELGEINGNDVSCDTKGRKKHPYENDGEHRIGNIDAHTVNLLSKSLENRVHRGIKIHDGNERGNHQNELCGIRLWVDHTGKLFGKASENSRCSDGKDQYRSENSLDDPLNSRIVSFYICLGNFGNKKPRKGARNCGRKENQRKNHAMYRSVCRKRDVARGTASLKSPRNEEMLDRDKCRANVSAEGYGKGGGQKLFFYRSSLTRTKLLIGRFSPFPKVKKILQEKRDSLGCNGTKRNRKAGTFHIFGAKERKQKYTAENTNGLPNDHNGGILIDTSYRDKISAEDRRERQRNECQSHGLQRLDRSYIVQNPITDEWGKEKKNECRSKAEAKRIDHAFSYRTAYGRGLFSLLVARFGNKLCGGKSDA